MVFQIKPLSIITYEDEQTEAWNENIHFGRTMPDNVLCYFELNLIYVCQSLLEQSRGDSVGKQYESTLSISGTQLAATGEFWGRPPIVIERKISQLIFFICWLWLAVVSSETYSMIREKHNKHEELACIQNMKSSESTLLLRLVWCFLVCFSRLWEYPDFLLRTRRFVQFEWCQMLSCCGVVTSSVGF